MGCGASSKTVPEPPEFPRETHPRSETYLTTTTTTTTTSTASASAGVGVTTAKPEADAEIFSVLPPGKNANTNNNSGSSNSSNRCCLKSCLKGKDENNSEMITSATYDLFHACRERQPLPRIQALVAQGARVASHPGIHRSALSYAVEAGCSADVIAYLIEQRSDVNDGSGSGNTVLQYALGRMGSPQLEVIQLLVAYSADVKARNRDGSSILHYAVSSPGKSTKLDLLRCLVGSSADVNARDHCQRSVLYVAVSRGNSLDVIQWLVDTSANVNATDVNGTSVLHLAVERYGNFAMIEFLVAHSADVNANAATGISVLQYGLHYGTSLDVVELLLAHSAELNATTPTGGRYGPSLLHTAVSSRRAAAEVVQFLIDKYSPDVKAKSKDGVSVLHHAVRSSVSLGVVECLVNHLADVNATISNDRSRDDGGDNFDDGYSDYPGYSVLHVAVRCSGSSSVEVLRFLLAHSKNDANMNGRGGGGGGNCLLTEAVSGVFTGSYFCRDHDSMAKLHCLLQCGGGVGSSQFPHLVLCPIPPDDDDYNDHGYTYADGHGPGHSHGVRDENGNIYYTITHDEDDILDRLGKLIVDVNSVLASAAREQFLQDGQSHSLVELCVRRVFHFLVKAETVPASLNNEVRGGQEEVRHRSLETFINDDGDFCENIIVGSRGDEKERDYDYYCGMDVSALDQLAWDGSGGSGGGSGSSSCSTRFTLVL